MSKFRLLVAALAIALIAAACGSGDGETETGGLSAQPLDGAIPESTDDADASESDDVTPTDDGSAGDAGADDDAASEDVDDPAVDAEPPAAEPEPEPVDEATALANAEAAIDSLAGNDDLRLIEVLDVRTGNATTLADAVDGDRPVLVWFWAPH